MKKIMGIFLIMILIMVLSSHKTLASNPNELLLGLINTVKTLQIQSGIEKSLIAKLEAAQNALISANPNHYKNSVNPIEAFKNEVKAQKGKYIPEGGANALLAQANNIIINILGTSAKSIGTGGGSFSITDKLSEIYGSSVSVPPGALPSATLITIYHEATPPAMPTNLIPTGPAVTFGPEGTTFSLPVTIAIPYNEISGIDENNLKIFAYGYQTDAWTEVTVDSRDTLNNILYAKVTHFSTFQAGAEPPTIDQNAPHFEWVVVWNQTSPTGNELFLAASVIDKDGEVPTTIKSLTVQGPDNFFYKFSYLDYYYDIPLKKGIYRATIPLTSLPKSGDYTFSVEDLDGKVTSMTKNLTVMPITPVNKTTFNPPDLADSGAVSTTPILSWDPVYYESEKPIYYRIFIENWNRTVIYRSKRFIGTQFVVSNDPSHENYVPLLENAIYYWRVDAFDADIGSIASNVSRSDMAIFATGSLSLTNSPIFEYPRAWTDNDFSRTPNFMLHLGGKLRKGIGGPIMNCDEIKNEGISITIKDPTGTIHNITPFNISPPSYTSPLCYMLYNYFYLDIKTKPDGTPIGPEDIPPGEYLFTATDRDGNLLVQLSDFLSKPKKLPFPVQSLPADKSILNPTPTFIWEPVEGARTYQINIDGLIDGQRIRIFESPLITDTAYKYTTSDPPLQPDIQYWWRVRAFDGQNFGEIDSRSNGAWREFKVDPNAPYFNWVTVLNDSYPYSTPSIYNLNLVAYTKDPNGYVGTENNTIASLTVIGPKNFSFSFNPSDPMFYIPLNDYIYASPLIPGVPADGRYVFQVTDIEGKTSIAYKDLAVNPVPIVDKRSFNIPDGSSVSTTPTLSWSPISDPRIIYYRVRIMDSNERIIYDSPISTSNQVTIPSAILSSGSYYRWRVQAFDAPRATEASNRSNSDWAYFFTTGTPPSFCSGIYDDFDGPSINTALWEIRDPCNILSLSGGLLNGKGPPNSCYGQLYSTRIFTGDFEFALDYSNFSSNATSFSENAPQISLQVISLSKEISRDFIYIFRGYLNKNNQFVSNGFISGSWMTGFWAMASSPSGSIKISRIGSTVTTYYQEKDDWVELGSFPDAFDGDVKIEISVYSGDDGGFEVSSDRISVQAKNCY